jgi:hypothetical protein
MDEESQGGGKPSSIKPPMIKPPMAVPSHREQPTGSFQSPAQWSSAPSQSPPAKDSSNKLVLVINIILAIALVVGLLILAYRWLK